MNCFDIETKGEEIWIVDNTACHIDGEPFKYKQANKSEAEMLCEVLNDLKQDSFVLKNIMEIIHNIRHNNWKWEDLIDYLYNGKDMDDLWCRYDEITKMIKEMKE